MGVPLVCLALVGIAVLILVLEVLKAYALAQNAYASGMRAGFKIAIEIVQERGEVATICAPRGNLAVGLIRAQTMHQVETDLRTVMGKVKVN